jgi:hypothetical protein
MVVELSFFIAAAVQHMLVILDHHETRAVRAFKRRVSETENNLILHLESSKKHIFVFVIL